MALIRALTGKSFLLDSNYIIGILNGTLSPSLIPETFFSISVVTVMEIYALAGMSEQEQKRIDTAISNLFIIPITTAIAKRAGLLLRTRHRGKADLLIAATALENNMILVTKNIRDFKSIPSLKITTEIA